MAIGGVRNVFRNVWRTQRCYPPYTVHRVKEYNNGTHALFMDRGYAGDRRCTLLVGGPAARVPIQSVHAWRGAVLFRPGALFDRPVLLPDLHAWPAALGCGWRR